MLRRAVLALLIGVVALIGQTMTGRTRTARAAGSDELSETFQATDRNTDWQLAERTPLRFQTFHPQGLAFVGDRMFLSSVEILEKPVKYPSPVGGFDRSTGRGIGHVFVMDRQGNLQQDIRLGEGTIYHPGGIDFDGQSVWVPVAEYRPHSRSIVYRLDPQTLTVTEAFRVSDHIGAVSRDREKGHLTGANWGSRELYTWNVEGHQVDRWRNPSHFLDYQDCQSAGSHLMLCDGIVELPQRSGGAKYELGGLALIDLRDHHVVHEVPLQRFSAAGHVVTRNPMKLFVDGNVLQLWVAPDDGEEIAGTELLHYRAAVTPLAGKSDGDDSHDG